MNAGPWLRVAAAEREWFASLGLDDFEALWRAPATPVETGNRARGGTSAVGILELASPDGPRRYYLKRQRNFNCRTLRHCWRGIPVAQREWQAIEALRRRGIATLEVAAFGRQRRAGEDRALLLTRALDGHRDLDTWLAENTAAEPRRRLAEAVGALIARLHRAGWRHGCLYPKHLFVAQDFTAGAAREPLRLIDLEKCRRIRGRWGGLRDLDTLFRHGPALDSALRESVLASYIAGRELSIDGAALARRIARSKR